MIVCIFTGGTISMRRDTPDDGAVPALRGRDILALAPGLDRIAELEVDDWGAFPGPHMNIERVWALRARVLEHLARPEVDGIVVTHGTDALEETAYLIARSIDATKPIVFTGAMRTSSELGWDGPGNLGDAVLAAACKDLVGHGVLVAMSDRVFSAFEVTKVHTSVLETFDSPAHGPVAVVDDGHIIVRQPPVSRPAPIMPKAPATPIDIVFAYSGADSRLLDASRDAGGRGVVIAAMGRGNVPPEMVGGIERWIAEAKPVVITSRTLRGRVGRTYGYAGGGARLAEAGALFAGALRPSQARIDTMLALGAGRGVAELRELLDRA